MNSTLKHRIIMKSLITTRLKNVCRNMIALYVVEIKFGMIGATGLSIMRSTISA